MMIRGKKLVVIGLTAVMTVSAPLSALAAGPGGPGGHGGSPREGNQGGCTLYERRADVERIMAEQVQAKEAKRICG